MTEKWFCWATARCVSTFTSSKNSYNSIHPSMRQYYKLLKKIFQSMIRRISPRICLFETILCIYIKKRCYLFLFSVYIHISSEILRLPIPIFTLNKTLWLLVCRIQSVGSEMSLFLFLCTVHSVLCTCYIMQFTTKFVSPNGRTGLFCRGPALW